MCLSRCCTLSATRAVWRAHLLAHLLSPRCGGHFGTLRRRRQNETNTTRKNLWQSKEGATAKPANSASRLASCRRSCKLRNRSCISGLSASVIPSLIAAPLGTIPSWRGFSSVLPLPSCQPPDSLDALDLCVPSAGSDGACSAHKIHNTTASLDVTRPILNMTFPTSLR